MARRNDLDDWPLVDGAAILRRRRARAWSRERLAIALYAGGASIASRHLARIEKGETERIDPDNLRALAKVLGCSQRELSVQS